MTVAATTNRKTYTGDNVTTSFATSPVIFYATSDLQVRVTVIATGVSTLLTLNTHYTVSGGSSAGAVGTVSLAGGSSPHGALLSTEKLVILRVLPLTQGVDLVNNNNSDAEVLEAALDKLTDVDQQIQEQADRSIRFASGDVSGSVTEIPDVTTRAGKLLGFDVTGLLTTIIVTAGTSLVDFASSIGSTLIGFIQAGVGAVLRTLQSIFRERVSVFDFMTPTQIADVIAGTKLVNVAVAIQAAIDYCTSIGCVLLFPQGVYLTGTTTLIFKNNVIYRGAGRNALGTKGTVIWYTGVSDAVQINNPINSVTSANYAIEDLYVICTVRTAGKASIADVGSSFVTMKRVGCSGNDYGIILDQSELVLLDECDLEIPVTGTAGLWLVNGAAHSPGASGFFTNRITARHCQFNGTVGVGIADDGGAMHSFIDNNYNAMAKHIRATQVNGLRIAGGQFEGGTATAIHLAVTYLAGGASTACPDVSIRDSFLFNSTAVPLITIDAGAGLFLTTENLYFQNSNAGGSPFSGRGNCANYSGKNNQQVGIGSADVGNSFSGLTAGPISYVPVFSSTNLDAALGNGTITGVYVREGNLCTAQIAMTFGTTTAKGTGSFNFTLPFGPLGGTGLQLGTFIANAPPGRKCGAAFINGTNVVTITEDAIGDVGGGSYVWVNGNVIFITMTYIINPTA